MTGRDWVLYELEWGEYAVERLREQESILAMPGRWGGSRDDLLTTVELAAMRPVGWWRK